MRRRGLTLLEVLAATVLMTMIAAACIPILRSAASLLRDEDDDRINVHELACFLDSWLQEHGDDLAPEEFADGIELAWPEDPHRPPVYVQLLSASNETADHIWLIFTPTPGTPGSGQRESGGYGVDAGTGPVIIRWVAVEPDEGEGQ